MAHAQVLSAVGLIKTTRRSGFCPACRLFQSGDGAREISGSGLIALAFLIVAAIAWAWIVVKSGSMDGMTVGLGPLGPFMTSWAVMMAAMMLPTATPLVFEFARNAEGRHGWRVATVLLGVTYLGIWMAFGVALYALYVALGMPWPNHGLVGGAALAGAGLYALTPVKRTSEAACRERCALHSPLPFSLMRGAVVAGARYGLSCLGCSAGLMAAMVLVGMASLPWMIVLTAVVLMYKLGPVPRSRSIVALSATLVALGLAYAASVA